MLTACPGKGVTFIRPDSITHVILTAKREAMGQERGPVCGCGIEKAEGKCALMLTGQFDLG